MWAAPAHPCARGINASLHVKWDIQVQYLQDTHTILMLDDVEINPPDHSAVIGPEAAKQWVQREFMDKFDVKLDIHPLSFYTVNSTMHVKGKFDLHMTPKDGGEAESVSGAFYNTFKEAGDGAWKHKYLMFSFD